MSQQVQGSYSEWIATDANGASVGAGSLCIEDDVSVECLTNSIIAVAERHSRRGRGRHDIHNVSFHAHFRDGKVVLAMYKKDKLDSDRTWIKTHFFVFPVCNENDLYWDKAGWAVLMVMLFHVAIALIWW